MPKREVQVDPEERLLDCPEKPSAIAWPMPVDRRLDELVAAAREVGERTTRKEMAAAIVLAFDAAGDGLSDTLRNYRLARARDAVMAAPSADNVLHLPRHPPGPRVTNR
jgi:hypothetical protein